MCVSPDAAADRPWFEHRRRAFCVVSKQSALPPPPPNDSRNHDHAHATGARHRSRFRARRPARARTGPAHTGRPPASGAGTGAGPTRAQAGGRAGKKTRARPRSGPPRAPGRKAGPAAGSACRTAGASAPAVAGRSAAPAERRDAATGARACPTHPRTSFDGTADPRARARPRRAAAGSATRPVGPANRAAARRRTRSCTGA